LKKRAQSAENVTISQTERSPRNWTDLLHKSRDYQYCKWPFLTPSVIYQT